VKSAPPALLWYQFTMSLYVSSNYLTLTLTLTIVLTSLSMITKNININK